MHELIQEISALVRELHLDREQRKTEFEWIKSHYGFVTKQDLTETEHRIMSKITEWADAEEADLADIKNTLDGIVTGVAALDKLITDFQNSPGTLSPEDQARLDAIQQKVTALRTQAKAIDTTAPTPPPVNPV